MQERDLPAPALESVERHSSWCVLTSAGFQTWTAEEVRSWTGEEFLVRVKDHAFVSALRPSLTESWCVLAWPYLARFGPTLLRPDGFGKMKDLLDRIGAEVREESIDGQTKWFLDLGYPTGFWYLRWEWLDPKWGHPSPMFDVRHPLSEFLLRWCRDPLPPRSHLLVSTLFRDPKMKATRRSEVAQQLVAALREEGVTDEAAGIGEEQTRGPRGHKCPYP